MAVYSTSILANKEFLTCNYYLLNFLIIIVLCRLKIAYSSHLTVCCVCKVLAISFIMYVLLVCAELLFTTGNCVLYI